MGKEYIKVVCCHPAYLTFMQSTAAAAKSLRSFLTLWDPIDGSPPGSAVPGILQARILEWVAISFSNAWKWKVKVKSLSRVRLFAGSSIHGIFQARVEWVAISFSFMQNTSCEMLGWIKHKRESRLQGEISVTLDMQMTPLLRQKAKRNQRASWWMRKRRVKKLA